MDACKCSKWQLASTSVPHTLVTGTCDPTRSCGPNGTSDSIMTKKTPKLGRIDQFGQGRIIIINTRNLRMH